MSSVAYRGLPAVRPPPLPWRPALAAAFLGWLGAFLAVAAVGFAASALGLVGRPQGSGLRDWPYPEAGWASLAANAVVWLWILALTALLVRGLLFDRVQRPVSAVTVFVALAVTGFAPFLPHGLLELPWLVALLVTAALLRLAPRFVPPIAPKRVTAACLAVGSLALVVPVLHGFLHPLWPGSTVFYDPPARNTVMFSVRNAGFADVELEAVSLRAPSRLVPPGEVVGVRVDDHPPAPPGAPFDSPRLPYRLEGRSDAFVQLRLRTLGCGTGTLPTTAEIAYRVRGAKRVLGVPVPVTLRPCDPRVDG